MPPASAAEILRLMEEQERRLNQRFDTIEERAHETLEQVKKTNGRVTQLELWQARWEGSKAALGFIQPLMISIGGGTVVAIVAVALKLIFG